MNQSNQNQNKPRKAPRLAGAEFKIDGNDLEIRGNDDEDDDDEGDDISHSLMEVVCLYPGRVKFSVDGRTHRMKEGEIIKLPSTYCTPVQHRPSGDPTPSVIQLLTNSKVLPIVDPRVAKDNNGVPNVTIKAREARAKSKTPLTPSQAGAGGTGA